MNQLFFLIGLAIAGGIAVTLQAQFMGLMDETIGTLESIFITYGSGSLLIGLVMLYLRGGNLAAWQQVPRYALLAGVVGLVIVGTIGYTVPRLGLVLSLTLIVAVQFTVAAVLDHFGLFGATLRPMTLSRLLGMLIVFAGVWLLVR
ncbi:MAG: DMT family transporter [Chloroflexota bacterium]